MKKINRFIDADRFIKLMAQRGLVVSPKQFNRMKHGQFLVMIHNLEKGTKTFYFLKKIFIKEFNMPYSNTPGTRKGAEVLISNLKLPKGKIV